MRARDARLGCGHLDGNQMECRHKVSRALPTRPTAEEEEPRRLGCWLRAGVKDAVNARWNYEHRVSVASPTGFQDELLVSTRQTDHTGAVANRGLHLLQAKGKPSSIPS